ncbi:MAG TPA: alpha/beta hydrolase [Syntrophales bacterium]|nr:alpha/beta hydrolase [Syntrophales bacterium]
MIREEKKSLQVRKYGAAPFDIVLVHGGPGAAGEMATLAADLASGRGILEPLQTATSVTGQVAELADVIETLGNRPVILVGFSWGAWLSLMAAAEHPASVRKLILIGCGPFEEELSFHVLENRLNRLEEEEKTAFISNLLILSDPEAGEKDAALANLGTLVAKTDSFDPIQEAGTEQIDYRGDIFQRVWEEAAEMRRTGKLLDLGTRIKCPVVAIHGDTDPHPADGVQIPLEAVLKDFQFILLKNCGHKPWIERRAREEFFRILDKELS